MASVFSMGSSDKRESTTGDVGPDLEEAMAMYQRGLMDATRLHALLEKTFGKQVCICALGVCVSTYISVIISYATCTVYS